MHLEHPTNYYRDTDPCNPFRVTDSISTTRNSSETEQEVEMRDSVERTYIHKMDTTSRNIIREIIYIFNKI